MTTTLWGAAMGRRGYCLGLAAALCCGLATVARADVHIEGSPAAVTVGAGGGAAAAVRVESGGAAISDVLSAFAGKFKVTYRTAIPLDAVADASYAGSFGQV